MLDIKLFREHADVIKASEQKRGKDSGLKIEQIKSLDIQWRNLIQEVQEKKEERNRVNMEILKAKKAGEDASDSIKKMQGVAQEIKDLDEQTTAKLQEKNDLMYSIGNIVDNGTPTGNVPQPVSFFGPAKVQAEHMKIIKAGVGELPLDIQELQWKPKMHTDLVAEKGWADVEKAAEVAGARFYYLKGDLARLNLALINYATDLLVKKGYEFMWVPFMINKNAMKAAAELADFEETLYKIEGEDLYLIPSAEQPLAAYHMNEMLKAEELPMKYAGFSTNFRKEAGAHGKDTRGIYRVHQFDKIEQFIFCLPNQSEQFTEEMIQNAEEIVKGLELPFRTVLIPAEDLNDNASKKYDIEVWLPGSGKFAEVVSCSNCTDYQARKLNIRYLEKSGDRGVVHTLNSTGIATQRTLVAIIENYQNEDGSINIPKVLQPYMGGQKLIE